MHTIIDKQTADTESLSMEEAAFAFAGSDTPVPDHELFNFYRREGGLLTGDQLAHMLMGRVDQPVSMVARWIVDRRVVCLKAGTLLLLPIFQFELSQASIHLAVEGAVKILRRTMTDAGIANWFAIANPHLDHRAPAQAVRMGAQSLDAAARQAGLLRAV